MADFGACNGMLHNFQGIVFVFCSVLFLSQVGDTMISSHYLLKGQ